MQSDITYKCIGSYDLEGNFIASGFNISNGYALEIYKFGKINKTKYFISRDKEAPLISGSWVGISASFYQSQYYYEGKIPDVNTVTLFSDGKIIPDNTTTAFQNYNITFEHFTALMNDGDAALKADSWSDSKNKSQTADFIFYNKDGYLYLLVLTNPKTKAVKPGTLKGFLKK